MRAARAAVHARHSLAELPPEPGFPSEPQVSLLPDLMQPPGAAPCGQGRLEALSRHRKAGAPSDARDRPRAGRWAGHPRWALGPPVFSPRLPWDRAPARSCPPLGAGPAVSLSPSPALGTGLVVAVTASR